MSRAGGKLPMKLTGDVPLDAQTILAGMAMQGYLARGTNFGTLEDLSEMAVQAADALIERLKK